jgi:hypothetical protein
MQVLLVALENPALKRDVKPPMLSVFGDVAMAIGAQFQRYLAPPSRTMVMLYQASKITVRRKKKEKKRRSSIKKKKSLENNRVEWLAERMKSLSGFLCLFRLCALSNFRLSSSLSTTIIITTTAIIIIINHQRQGGHGERGDGGVHELSSRGHHRGLHRHRQRPKRGRAGRHHDAGPFPF